MATEVRYGGFSGTLQRMNDHPLLDLIIKLGTAAGILYAAWHYGKSVQLDERKEAGGEKK